MPEPLDPRHPGRFSPSLITGLRVLACFSPKRPVRGIADMAAELGLDRTTTHRYATTLVALGYLEQNTLRKYRLAPRSSYVALALLDTMAVRRIARKHLRELRALSGYTVSLGVHGGGEVLYIDRCHGSRQGQYAIDVGIGLGARRPVYCTAAGKALLARLPAAEQHEVIKGLRLKRWAPRTIMSKTALQSELDRIAMAGGVAVEDEELLAGRRALGAAVLDAGGGPIAVVELVTPAAAHGRDGLKSLFSGELAGAVERIEAALYLDAARTRAGPKGK